MPKNKTFHRWSEEEIEILRAFRPTHSFVEIKWILFDTYGIEVTERAIEQKCIEQKIHSNNNGRFKKGHVPANKGKHISEEHRKAIQATMFKKGVKPPNYKPIGSTKMRDGYLMIKDAKGWVYHHTVVWEENYGAVPEGYMIRHLDGDPANDNLDNLMLLSKGANAIFNKHFKLTKDIELNKTMFVRAELLNRISKREKELNEEKGNSKKNSSC